VRLWEYPCIEFQKKSGKRLTVPDLLPNMAARKSRRRAHRREEARTPPAPAPSRHDTSAPMTVSPPAGVGAVLRRTRELRGLSLHQIAAATKLSPAALEAIERDDISRLPGGIFTRAFVRAYAKELGVDPERTLHDFLAQFPDRQVEPHVAQPAVPAEPAVESYDAARMIVPLGIVIVPVAFAILWLTYGVKPESRDAHDAL